MPPSWAVRGAQNIRSTIGRLDMAKWNQLTMTVLGDVLEERQRQDDRWGEQNHPSYSGDSAAARSTLNAQAAVLAEHWQQINAGRVKHDSLTWDGILHEEVYEALAECDGPKLYAELVQVAAVAACWAEKLRRHGKGPKDPRAEVDVEWDGNLAVSNKVYIRPRGFGRTIDSFNQQYMDSDRCRFVMNRSPLVVCGGVVGHGGAHWNGGWPIQVAPETPGVC